MSTQKSPEKDHDQLENSLPIIGSDTVNKLLLNLVMDFSTTEKQTNLLRKLYHFNNNNNNNSGPTVKWFDDLMKLLNILEYTRDSSKSIRETINSEIWLKISKFVENYNEKELNFNTLSLDPSLLFISAPKTPLLREDINNESKTKSFSSSSQILENSLNNLQSASNQKLSDKYPEESKEKEETPNVSSKSSETKRKSKKSFSKNNKRTKKYSKHPEIEGTSIMTYPIKENSHETLIWKIKKTNDNSQSQTQPQQYPDFCWMNNTISTQHNVNYSHSHKSQQEILTAPNIQEISTIPNIHEMPIILNFQDRGVINDNSGLETNLRFTSNTTIEVDNSEENLSIYPHDP
ncbi:hypothetical protein Glove_67g115 [Diversispora epigaea]|uniref:Uncharacterized protein n=1 Tax=Diversispora epigaea TaxID=1348612 RepID=A0A397JDR2_9GLOM|nr:hypothetical protein Glove_67g115 [Diversispora epigaea]